jgi:hypothetical protein
MTATSTNDLLLIHHRYPVLAFLLALCNPSTILSGVQSISHHRNPRQPKQMLRSKRSQGFNEKIDQYFSLSFSAKRYIIVDLIHDILLHLAAGGIAGIMLWQATILGMRGVIVFACWTWNEPFTWVGVGGLIHLLRVITWRLCLGPISTSQKWSRWWHWNLSHAENLALSHPHWARFSDFMLQAIG